MGVSGPTAPKAAQIAAYMSFFVVGTTNEPDFIAAFSIIFLSGLILVLISLLRISHLIHYTPYPVMAGFMCGIGALVILTQLNAFIGLSVEKNIPDVFKNLNKYSEKNPGRVTVKYILTEGNSSDHELEQFVENCIKYNLDQCCYQISMNYKFEDLSFDNFKAAIYLFSKLISNKVKKVFIDDHILARFSQLGENEIEKLKKFLKMKKIENVIFDSEKINSIVIFGAGQLSKELINKAKFFKNAKFDIVDSSKAKIGKIFNGKVIKDPVILKNDKRPIYISAAQSYDSIFSYLNTLNKTDDIISGIFI